MTATRKHRGQAPTGMAPGALFWNRTHGQDEPEAVDNPKLRRCPWPPCRALPGQPCTVTVGRGRRKPIAGYHDARKEPTA